MKESYFEQCKIAYRTSKILDGRQTIIFVHGLTGSCSAWYEYESLFEEEYNIVTMDIRGHGQSVKYKSFDDYQLEYFAEDVLELLDHLQVQSFVLVSHSLGTLIALQIALRRKKSIEAMILLCPAYNIQNIRSWLMIPLLRLAVAGMGLCPFLAPVRGRTDYKKYRGTGDFNLRRVYADIRNTSLRVHLFTLLQIYLFDQEQKWNRLAVPILVIHGTKDGIVPVAQIERMKKVLPSIQVLLLDRADHILILNKVSDVSKAIKGFIGRKS